MSTMRLNGTTIGYHDVGNGDPVLFLHAFPLDRGMWEMQVQALNAEMRVITMDARGFGESAADAGGLSMETLADDAAALLAALHVDRAVVAGLSLGGYAALALFRKHPQVVRGLVLADTRATADDEEGKKNREAFARNAVANGEGWIANEMIPKLLRPNANPAVVSAVREIIRAQTPSSAASMSRAIARRPDSTDLLPAIACPTLVIVGKEDKVTTPEIAREMASRIPGARCVEIPDAGHLSNLENPQDFNAAIQDFLRERVTLHSKENPDYGGNR